MVIEQAGNAVVADVDSPHFDTGTHAVSFAAGSDSAEDALSIRHQGTGAGQITVSGSTVTYGGVPIGTFTGGQRRCEPHHHVQRQRHADRGNGVGAEYHLSEHRYGCSDDRGPHRAVCPDGWGWRHQPDLRHDGDGQRRQRYANGSGPVSEHRRGKRGQWDACGHRHGHRSGCGRYPDVQLARQRGGGGLRSMRRPESSPWRTAACWTTRAPPATA